MFEVLTGLLGMPMMDALVVVHSMSEVTQQLLGYAIS